MLKKLNIFKKTISLIGLVLAFSVSSFSLAQNVDAIFYNNKSPQSLKLLAKSDKFDAYVDQNRQINNSDGSVTAEIILELREPMEDGTKSRALTYTYYCNDKNEKKASYIDFSNYSGSKKSGNFIKGAKQPFSQEPVKQNTVTEVLFNAVCSQSHSKTTQNPNVPLNQNNSSTPVSTQQNIINFQYINKLDNESIRRILQEGIGKDSFNEFLSHYSFIHTMFRYMNPNKDEYQDADAQYHRKAFAPFSGAIESNLRSMDLVLNNIARSLNTQPTKIFLGFGLELDRPLILKESTFNEPNRQPILDGRLNADSYWLRFPEKLRRVNEFYDARDPDALFNKFYPDYVNKINSRASSIVAVAQKYELQQIESAIKQKEREQWLLTNEGKKYLAEEEARRKVEIAERNKPGPYQQLQCKQYKPNGPHGQLIEIDCTSRYLVASATKTVAERLKNVGGVAGYFYKDCYKGFVDAMKGNPDLPMDAAIGSTYLFACNRGLYELSQIR